MVGWELGGVVEVKERWREAKGEDEGEECVWGGGLLVCLVWVSWFVCQIMVVAGRLSFPFVFLSIEVYFEAKVGLFLLHFLICCCCG